MYNLFLRLGCPRHESFEYLKASESEKEAFFTALRPYPECPAGGTLLHACSDYYFVIPGADSFPILLKRILNAKNLPHVSVDVPRSDGQTALYRAAERGLEEVGINLKLSCLYIV